MKLDTSHEIYRRAAAYDALTQLKLIQKKRGLFFPESPKL